MSKFFYARLAATNIRKNSKLYLPYILACMGTIMMFYIMLFITTSSGVSKMPGADALKTILVLGSIVIAIFSVIILFYTNSFLIKRRKKELGLFNILGMEKKHIAKVMALENFYIAIVSLIIGIFVGILFSKLLLLLLLKLMQFEVPFGFKVSPIAIGLTLLLFIGIFILTLVANLRQVHLSKPVELLHGGDIGEKEPKTKLALAIIGFLTLGAGYTIAIVTEKPVDALGLFFVAVVLVIIGTYCLFTAGSIALLKLLRKKKEYYYTTRHFISISGMIYRMKQNAVGLANICILSTMVLVMLSTTISLYVGLDDELRVQFPRNIEVNAEDISVSDNNILENKLKNTIFESGVDVKNIINYRYAIYSFEQQETLFTYNSDKIYASGDYAILFFIPLDEYNRMQGTNLTLSENETMVFSPKKSYEWNKVSFGNKNYSIKAKLNNLNVEEYFSTRLADTYYFIMPSEENIKNLYNEITKGNGDWDGFSFYYGFDVDGDEEQQLTLIEEISKIENISYSCAEANKNQFLSIYGGFLFLGLFLGALFIMATVLIMYYKQISEGYEDKNRFEIMQKVGMSHHEVKSAIRSQVLTVFFLPLLVAGIHIIASFKMITRLLLLLNLTDVTLFIWCTLATFLVFAVLYAIVYSMTAKVYYKIVE